MIGWNFWRRLEILERWIDCRSPPHVNKTENNTVGLFSCRAFGFLFVLSHRKFFFSGANFLFLRVFGHFTDHKRPIDRMSTENFQGWCFGRRPITFFCFACISVCLPLFFFFFYFNFAFASLKTSSPVRFYEEENFFGREVRKFIFSIFHLIWPFERRKKRKKIVFIYYRDDIFTIFTDEKERKLVIFGKYVDGFPFIPTEKEKLRRNRSFKWSDWRL